MNSSVAATQIATKSDFNNSITLFAPSTTKLCSSTRYFFTCNDLIYLILALEIIVKKLKRLLYVLLLPLLLSSCLGTRYLQENQKLLYRQTIEAPKGFNSSGLSDLYVKKVNRRFLGLPINSLVWMHHEGERSYD